MKRTHLVFWIARIVVAIILWQTLFFKFSAAPESVEIFTKVGMEPWGRIGVGVMELITAILILVPATVWLGSILAIGLMLGAIGLHFTLIGIVVMNDGGQLFIYAVLVLICSLYIFWKSKKQIPHSLKTYLPSFLQ